ncbi:MAG: prepilin-type N-terminal cleavage/methylation domain-containing protein [Candidatus Aenigmatarchaeota archaeon]
MKDTSRRNPFNSKNGFSLLEVMIAMLILSLALSTIIYSEMLSLRAAQRIRNIDIATSLASSKISEIEAEGFPATGEREGNFGDEFPLFRWKANILPTSNPSIRELRVQVIFNEGKGQEQIELITYLADLK